MKRSLLLLIAFALVLTLVLFTGCPSTQETITTTTTAVQTATATVTNTVTPTPTTTTVPPLKLTSIAIAPTSPPTLTVGDTQAFVATGTYSDGSTNTLYSATWTSSDPSVATFDSFGVATAVGAGETNVTVTQFGIKSASVALTVVAAPESTTTPVAEFVYVSVSVDGVLVLAAQPVAYTKDMTIEGAVKGAHTAYYADGLEGYQADESAFGAGYYIINMCWGIKNIPCIIVNDTPNSQLVFQAVNAVKVKANDNIIICTGKSGSTLTPVSLKAVLSGGKVTVTAKIWAQSPSDYTWSSSACKNANVLDSEGNVLGTTDDNGEITIDIPADGIVIIEGLAAINVNASGTEG